MASQICKADLFGGAAGRPVILGCMVDHCAVSVVFVNHSGKKCRSDAFSSICRCCGNKSGFHGAATWQGGAYHVDEGDRLIMQQSKICVGSAV